MSVNLSQKNKSELLDLAQVLLCKAAGEPISDRQTTPLIKFWTKECTTTQQCIDMAKHLIELVKDSNG